MSGRRYSKDRSAAAKANGAGGSSWRPVYRVGKGMRLAEIGLMFGLSRSFISVTARRLKSRRNREVLSPDANGCGRHHDRSDIYARCNKKRQRPNQLHTESVSRRECCSRDSGDRYIPGKTMILRGHCPIYGCNDHSVLPRRESVLPREFHWLDRRRSERCGTLKRVPPIKFGIGKPERFALAFRSTSGCTFAQIKSREIFRIVLVACEQRGHRALRHR